jgi:hypothetical protein
MRPMNIVSLAPLALAVACTTACAGSNSNIRGTKIRDSADNREIIEVVERYRKAIEAQDLATLLRLASPRYWEDGGTVKADDDYGYNGLREVLAARLARVKDIRYSLKYHRIDHRGRVANVYVYIDGSYTVTSGHGEERIDQRDPGLIVLERAEAGGQSGPDQSKWLFVSGM